MPKRNGLKCRERLVIEEFIRMTKQPGVPLHFSAEDVWRHGKTRAPGLPALRLNIRGLRKALQNMVYADTGVQRDSRTSGFPAQYVVMVDTHDCWAEDPTAIIAGASSSTRKKHGVTVKGGKKVSAPPTPRTPVREPPASISCEEANMPKLGMGRSELEQELVKLRRELAELRRSAAGALYAVTETEYKGHPVLTFTGPGLRAPLTLGLSKLRAVEANWNYVVEFLAKNQPATITS